MGPSSLLLSILILVLLSMFFSLAETAFVSVPEEKIFKMSQDGDKRAKMTLNLLSNKDKIISIALLCDNISNIAASSISAVFFADLFGEYDEIGILLSTIIMTILVFVFGEVLPKMIAMRQATSVALSITPLFVCLSRILLPILWIINKMTSSIVRFFHIKNEADSENANNSILGAVEMYHKKGTLEQDEKNMLSGVLQLDSIDMKDIMTHRSEMFAIDINEDVNEIVKKIIDNRYTKIPFYDKSDDNILGVLYNVDFLKTLYSKKNINKEDIKNMLKEPWYLPGDASVGGHLHEFKEKGNVLAFVVDEFGGTMGIVSLEDVLEQIVGEINSDNGNLPFECKKNNDGSYIVDGDAPINELNEIIGSNFIDSEVSTIGGFLINKINKLPAVDEEFDVGEYKIKVIETNETRILRLKIKKKAD